MATTFFEHIEMIFSHLLGSIFSWGLLSLCFAGYKKYATRNLMSWINRSAGICLVGCGIAACISAILLVA
jgi:hypothetical protein